MTRISKGPDLADRSDTSVARPTTGLDRQILAVFLIALVVRIVYFLTVRGEPYYQVPLLDSAWYHRSALGILRDGFWGDEVFFRAPLYSYFVAFSYRFFGETPVAPKIIQIALGAGTCALLTAVARRVFDRRTALISGIVAALYPTLIFFDGELLATGPASFLGLLLLYRVLEALRQSAWRPWLAAGAVLGLAAITRPPILLFGAGLGIWMLAARVQQRGGPRSDRLLRGRSLAALLIGTVLVIAPVTLRNAVIGGDFVPIASQGGVNFYMGNHPGADGKSAVLPGWSESEGDWITFEDDTRRMAEAEAGRSLSPSGESRFWTGKALSFIVTQPIEAAGLFSRKIYYLLNGFEIPNNKDPYFFKQYSPALNGALWKKGLAFPTGLLIPLAVMGLLLAPRRRETSVLYVFLLCQAVAIVLFFACARYRVALLPVLIPFAVWGAGRLGRRFRTGPAGSAAVLGIVAVAFLVLSNSNFLGVGSTARWQDHYDLGLVHAERGEYAQARTAFEEALRLKPGDVSVIYNLGIVQMSLGNLEESVVSFRSVLGIDPAMMSARKNLGMALGRMGRLDEAEREFRRILELDPTHPEALANLRLIERMRGESP